MTVYAYQCEYCKGNVQPQQIEREVFEHKNGFVILEDIAVGICDVCGNRYYSADILHAVHKIATGKQKPERTDQVPVAHLEPVR